MKKINTYWFWLPLVHCLLLTLGYFLCHVFVQSLGNDLGNVVYALVFIVLYTFVMAPLTSISYCKRIRTMSWRKYLCCIYNAVMTAMYFTLCMLPENVQALIYSVISIPWIAVFFSSLLCGAMTLIISDVKNLKIKRG